MSLAPISTHDSSRMGDAVEHILAATCILRSRAQLNVPTSLVGDEGADLVFHRRGGMATNAAWVKSRMRDSKLLSSGTLQQNVRTETLRWRDALFHA